MEPSKDKYKGLAVASLKSSGSSACVVSKSPIEKEIVQVCQLACTTVLWKLLLHFSSYYISVAAVLQCFPMYQLADIVQYDSSERFYDQTVTARLVCVRPSFTVAGVTSLKASNKEIALERYY